MKRGKENGESCMKHGVKFPFWVLISSPRQLHLCTLAKTKWSQGLRREEWSKYTVYTPEIRIWEIGSYAGVLEARAGPAGYGLPAPRGGGHRGNHNPPKHLMKFRISPLDVKMVENRTSCITQVKIYLHWNLSRKGQMNLRVDDKSE